MTPMSRAEEEKWLGEAITTKDRRHVFAIETKERAAHRQLWVAYQLGASLRWFRNLNRRKGLLGQRLWH